MNNRGRHRPRAGGRPRRHRPGQERPITGTVGSPERRLFSALDRRWKDFLKQRRICQAGFSEPAVHDLRVAIRRLVAALDLLTTIADPDQLAIPRQHLKSLLKRMGQLRDTQVQILSAKKLVPQFRFLEVFSTVLLLRERRELNRVVRRLEKLRTGGMQQTIFTVSRGVEGSMRDPSAMIAVRTALQGSLGTAFLKLVRLRRGIVISDPLTIHRFRIAFKRFRYATEILRPDTEESHHKAMNDFQTRMGTIRDLEVLMGNIRQFGVGSPVRPGTRRRVIPAVSLAIIHRRLQRRHSVLVRRFIQSVNEFQRFYVPATTSS